MHSFQMPDQMAGGSRRSDVSDKPNVYACIAAVSAEIAKTGIGKERNNQAQGYKFRGIDDVYNALAPLISKQGLVIVPRILSRTCVERAGKNGGALFYVTVEAEFDFISSHDGSKVTARSFGEAMDSGDKATNKAMSAAYKYTAFQTFCIPTEGDNDADAHTHEPAAAAQKAPTVPTKPDGYDMWLRTYQAAAKKGIEELRKAYKAAPVACRDYLTKHDAQNYEKARADAETATKNEQAVPA
jgi:hypothetical protein